MYNVSVGKILENKGISQTPVAESSVSKKRAIEEISNTPKQPSYTISGPDVT
jgi:hypothetical protein